MNRIRVKGVVLETQKYREYDELCWLFTEHGQVFTAIIRGSKKKNAKYNGRLEPFTSFYFDLQKRPGLSVIYGFERVEKFVQKEESLLPLFLYGTQVNELIKKAVPQMTASSALFQVVENLYENISCNIYPELACTFLEKTLAPYLGVTYTFTHCISCGSTEEIQGFYFEQGGLLCRNCATFSSDSITNISLLKTLISFDRLNISNYAEIKLTEEQVEQLQVFWAEVYENSLGIVLKSQKIKLKGKNT